MSEVPRLDLVDGNGFVGRKTVLLVDDDVEFRRWIRPSFGTHRVLEAATVADAEDALVTEHPDLYVVDGGLPDADGAGWIERLRRRGVGEPIVFISAHERDRETVRHLTANLGVARVLHKPFDPTLVAGMLGGSEITSDSRDALASLSAAYAEAIPSKLQELERQVLESLSHPYDARFLDDAILAAHRLKGTAGSYGFPTVSAACARIESLLEQMRPQPAHQRFSAFLLVQDELSEAARLPVPGLPASGGAPGRFARRILVVGSDRSFVDAVRGLARRCLAETVTVPTVAKAQHQCATTTFDALVVHLDDATVDESLTWVSDLSQSSRGARIPVAVVSASRDVGRRVEAARAGATLFLESPIDPDTFEEALGTLLSLRSEDEPHVLAVDDDPDFLRFVSTALREHGIRVTTLGDPSRILELLDDARPDLVLLDVAMPEVDGLNLCRVLRTTPRWRHLPILLLTARGGVVQRVIGFQRGADDYLTKPVLIHEMVARVRVHVDRARLLRQSAERDILTGFLLRRAFLRSMSSRLSEAQRHGRPLTICLLDLDYFKVINDQHGHLAGDRVLQGLAAFLSIAFRIEDVRARWGGDEFVLAFPDASPESMEAAVRRAVSEFAEHPFVSDAGVPFRASFSAGLAGFPEDGGTIEELLRAADARLYAAKHAGRSRAVAQ